MWGISTVVLAGWGVASEGETLGCVSAIDLALRSIATVVVSLLTEISCLRGEFAGVGSEGAGVRSEVSLWRVVFLLHIDLREVANGINIVLEVANMRGVFLLWNFSLESWHVVSSGHVFFLFKRRRVPALLEIDDLDLESKSGATWNDITGSFITVGIFRRTGDDSLLALMHLDDTFFPTLNDLTLINLEFEGVLTILVLIENGSILESTLVEHLDLGVLWHFWTIRGGQGLHIESESYWIKLFVLHRKNAIFIFGVLGNTKFTFESAPNISLVVDAIIHGVLALNLGGSLEDFVDLGLIGKSVLLFILSKEFGLLLFSEIRGNVRSACRTFRTFIAGATWNVGLCTLMWCARISRGSIFSGRTSHILTGDRMTVRVNVSLLHEIFDSITVRVN